MIHGWRMLFHGSVPIIDRFTIPSWGYMVQETNTEVAFKILSLTLKKLYGSDPSFRVYYFSLAMDIAQTHNHISLEVKQVWYKCIHSLGDFSKD